MVEPRRAKRDGVEQDKARQCSQGRTWQGCREQSEMREGRGYARQGLGGVQGKAAEVGRYAPGRAGPASRTVQGWENLAGAPSRDVDGAMVMCWGQQRTSCAFPETPEPGMLLVQNQWGIISPAATAVQCRCNSNSSPTFLLSLTTPPFCCACTPTFVLYVGRPKGKRRRHMSMKRGNSRNGALGEGGGQLIAEMSPQGWINIGQGEAIQ